MRDSTEGDYAKGRRARYDFVMARLRRIAKFRSFACAIAFCATAVCPHAAPPQEITSRDTLWIVVHDGCVPDQLNSHDPKPCARVDLDDGVDKGFVILKDIFGTTQYLLIPTARIPGIESLIILAPDAPNYFADAWDARTYVDDALHQTLPREDIALAINSVAGRSQDQLHIHVDCIQPDVQAALQKQARSIRKRWTRLTVELSGHRYWAMWVDGENLGANNPFRLLAKGLPGAAQDMGDRTLVVVGATRARGAMGFVILEDQVDENNHDSANGEELLDHGCSIATAAAAATAAAQPKN
jgi:CDP-diacylglycerol pyrophosphatase